MFISKFSCYFQKEQKIPPLTDNDGIFSWTHCGFKEIVLLRFKTTRIRREKREMIQHSGNRSTHVSCGPHRIY